MSWRLVSLRQDSHAHGSCNQTPAFVLFEALQVDKRADEVGSGKGGGWRGGGGGLGTEEERQVRHRSLVSAIWSQRRQGDKRKKRIRGTEKRELQRGKLLACESKTFSTRAAVRAIDKKREKRRGRCIYRRATVGGIFLMHSITWTLCSRLTFIHQRLPLCPIANIIKHFRGHEDRQEILHR